MRFKLIIFTLLFLSFVNGIEHTIISGSLSLFADYFNVPGYIGWFTIIYTLSSILAAPIIGFYANGRPLKNLFRLGLLLMLIGFVICSIADQFYFLLIGRGVSGIGGGFISVLIPTFLGRYFELEKRAKIESYYFMTYTSGSLIGPLLGSFIINTLGWRGIFISSLIFFLTLAILLELGIKKEPINSSTTIKSNKSFLLQSFIFSMFLLSLLLIIEFFDDFHKNAMYYLAILIPFYLFISFKKISANSKTPLFHPDLIKNKFFGTVITYSFVFGSSKFIFTNFLPIYIIQVLNHSFTIANFSLTMLLIGNAIGNFITAKIIVKVKYKSIFTFSYLLQHIAIFTLFLYSFHSSTLILIIAFLLGFANGFAGYPGLLLLQNKYPDYMGSAAASNNMARHFGGVFGVVLFQQIVAQSNTISLSSFQTGFTLVWGIFTIFGLVVFLLPSEHMVRKITK